MATNEFAGGTLLYAQWIWSGGTVQINTDYRNFQHVDQGEWIDATNGGDTTPNMIPSLNTEQVTLDFDLQSDMGTITFAAFKRNTKGTLIWGEAGTAATKPKTTLPCYVYQATRTIPFKDVVSMSVQWNQNGARVDGAYS